MCPPAEKVKFLSSPLGALDFSRKTDPGMCELSSATQDAVLLSFAQR